MIKDPVAKHPEPITGNDTAKLVDIIVNSIDEKKGRDLICLDLKNIETSVCDYFVICHANSTTHLNTLAGFIEKKVMEIAGSKPWRKEGYENKQWVLMDYVNVVVHLFLPETRSFYNLEGLWADAEPVVLEADKRRKNN